MKRFNETSWKRLFAVAVESIAVWSGFATAVK
jgi:hypothetical protein